jgi:4,5-DOPA dioxygenase extradiol
MIEQSGFPVQEIIGRGLDHAVAGPLRLMYPEADIPVVQMAVQAGEGMGHHIALGRALSPLRQHNILLIGSGSLTHPAEEVHSAEQDFNLSPNDAAREFAAWVLEKAEAGLIDQIADYKALAPYSLENHPKPEHFVPFAFAMGAAGEGAKGLRVHTSALGGVTMLDSYIFE